MRLVGPHVIKPSGDALDWSRHANVVKALDDPAPLKVAPDGALRVFRAYFRDQPMEASPWAVAATILDRLGGYRHPDLYVEVFNETQAPASALVELHRQVAVLLHAAGVKVCGPCWSTGAYEAADWQAFRAAGWGGLDAIALHAYWGNQGFTIWHALRYRQFWQPGDPPVFITECGRDRVEGGKGGWRADGLSEDAYFAELRAYDAELLKDRYVLGATVFTCGSTPDWQAFDADPIAGRAVAAAEPYPTDRQTGDTVAGITKGIDVSNNNGAIDFDALRGSDRRFAFVKASEDDGFIDPFLKANLDGLKGLGWARGVYHFARPSVSSPADSVTLFQKAIAGAGGLAPGDLIALDIEDERVPEGQSLHQWVAEWLDLAERVFGVAPFKYSGKWYTSTRDLEHDDLARWPTWWASYTPSVPDPVPGWRPITIWQYQANGAEPGIAGDVDEDLFYDRLDALTALGLPGNAPPPPAPTPAPVPPPPATDLDARVARLEGIVEKLKAALS